MHLLAFFGVVASSLVRYPGPYPINRESSPLRLTFSKNASSRRPSRRRARYAPARLLSVLSARVAEYTAFGSEIIFSNFSNV